MQATYLMSEKDGHMVRWLSIAPAIISTVLCLFIFVATIWIWSRKHARPTIDRISFRLFWWTMGFELLYDVAYIVGEAFTGETATGAPCAVGIYLLIAPMGVVNYLCTCIAINLMLIICFGVNPTKWKMERWYVGGSIALGFLIPVIPTALGHFGHDPILNTCWVTAKNDEQRMQYMVLDLYLWQLLSCVIATVAVAMTIYSIFRLRRATSKAMFRSNALNQESGTLEAFDDQFLKMALRISTYPVALIIVNGFISGIDLHLSDVGGLHSKKDFHLYCLYYFLYGGRGIFFALIGLIVDPCFRKGFRAALRPAPSPLMPPVAITSDYTNTTDFTKKSEINTSLLPNMSYLPEESVAPDQMGTGMGRRLSEMDFMAAVTSIAPPPDLGRIEEGVSPVLALRRGSRKDLDDSVL